MLTIYVPADEEEAALKASVQEQRPFEWDGHQWWVFSFWKYAFSCVFHVEVEPAEVQPC